MNVLREEEYKEKKKQKILYIVIISICIVSIIAALIIQLNQGNEPTSGGNKLPSLTDDQVNTYKEQFNNIFENKVNYLKNNAYRITKIDEEEEIVYIGYKNNESKTNDYELNVKIPCINIRCDEVDEINTQIRDVFEKKAKSVLNTENNNVIYTVDYCAYISNNILSLIVKSTLKEGGNAQRDIVQTYNYDLKNHKKCTIDRLLEIKDITKKEASQTIKNEIKTIQERTDELSKLGYSVYPRDYTSDIYNINNATEYFLGEDNALYIIYAYGNLNHTSEMDIVVM